MEVVLYVPSEQTEIKPNKDDISGCWLCTQSLLAMQDRDRMQTWMRGRWDFHFFWGGGHTSLLLHLPSWVGITVFSFVSVFFSEDLLNFCTSSLTGLSLIFEDF